MATAAKSVPQSQTIRHGIWIMSAVGMAAIAAILLYSGTANRGDTDVSSQTGTSESTSVVVPDTSDASNGDHPLSDPLSQPLVDTTTDQSVEIPPPGEAVPVDYDDIDWSTYTQTEQGWSIDHPAGWYVYDLDISPSSDPIVQTTVISNKSWHEFEADGCYVQHDCIENDLYSLDTDWFYFTISHESVQVESSCSTVEECIVASCLEATNCQYPYQNYGYIPAHNWIDSTPLPCCNDPYLYASAGNNDWIMHPPLDYGSDTFELIANGQLYRISFINRYIVMDDPEGYPEQIAEPSSYLALFHSMMETFQSFPPGI